MATNSASHSRHSIDFVLSEEPESESIIYKDVDLSSEEEVGTLQAEHRVLSPDGTWGFLPEESEAIKEFGWSHPEIGSPFHSGFWAYAASLGLWWTLFEFKGHDGTIRWARRKYGSLYNHWKEKYHQMTFDTLSESQQQWWLAVKQQTHVALARDKAFGHSGHSYLFPVSLYHESLVYRTSNNLFIESNDPPPRPKDQASRVHEALQFCKGLWARITLSGSDPLPLIDPSELKKMMKRKNFVSRTIVKVDTISEAKANQLALPPKQNRLVELLPTEGSPPHKVQAQTANNTSRSNHKDQAVSSEASFSNSRRRSNSSNSSLNASSIMDSRPVSSAPTSSNKPKSNTRLSSSQTSSLYTSNDPFDGTLRFEETPKSSSRYQNGSLMAQSTSNSNLTSSRTASAQNSVMVPPPSRSMTSPPNSTPRENTQNPNSYTHLYADSSLPTATRHMTADETIQLLKSPLFIQMSQQLTNLLKSFKVDRQQMHLLYILGQVYTHDDMAAFWNIFNNLKLLDAE